LEHIQGVLSKACNIFAKWRGNAEDFMQAIISEDYKKQQETQQTAPLKADLPIAQQQGSQAVAPSVPPTRELVKEQYDQGFAEGFAKGKKEGRAAGIQEGEKAAKKQMKRGKWTIGEALGLAIPASVIVAAGLGILGGIFIGKAAHDDTSHHAVAADYADAADGGVDDSSAALPLDASKEKEDGDADRLEGRVDSAVDVADAQIERYVTKLFCRGDKIHFGRDVLRPEDRDSPYFHVYPASDDPEGRRAHHFWIEPGDCFKPGRNLLPDAEIEELLRIIREREEAIRRGDYSVMSDRERRREFAWTISCFPDDEIVLSSGLLDEENLTSTGTWRGRSFLHRAEPLHRGGPGGGYVIISPGRCFDPVTAGETDGGSPDAGSDADVTDSGSRVIGRAPIYTLPPPTGTTYRLVDPQSSRPRPRSR
jgi:hypothetical protein